MPQSLTTILNDADSESSETLQVRVTANDSAISIFPKGYGDFGSAPGTAVRSSLSFIRVGCG